jgi:hypothetical protein
MKPCSDCDEVYPVNELERFGELWLCKLCVRWGKIDLYAARAT